jgi:hypothetical protein
MLLDVFKILISLIPGVVNSINVYLLLCNDCKQLPFVRLYSYWAVRVLIIVEILVPFAFFWIMFASHQPQIDIPFVFSAILTGLAFPALMNATTRVGSLPIDIKAPHEYCLKLARDAIIQYENLNTTKFWATLEIELIQKINEPLTLRNGKVFLENYVRTIDNLLPEKKARLADKLKQLDNDLQSSDFSGEKKAKKIVIFIQDNINRNSWSLIVQSFDCVEFNSLFYDQNGKLISPKN